jgi:hypothetical protein
MDLMDYGVLLFAAVNLIWGSQVMTADGIVLNGKIFVSVASIFTLILFILQDEMDDFSCMLQAPFSN